MTNNKKLVMGVLFEAKVSSRPGACLQCWPCGHFLVREVRINYYCPFEKRSIPAHLAHSPTPEDITQLIEGFKEIGLARDAIVNAVRSSNGGQIYDSFKLDPVDALNPSEPGIGPCVPVDVLIEVATQLLDKGAGK